MTLDCFRAVKSDLQFGKTGKIGTIPLFSVYFTLLFKVKSTLCHEKVQNHNLNLLLYSPDKPMRSL